MIKKIVVIIFIIFITGCFRSREKKNEFTLSRQEMSQYSLSSQKEETMKNEDSYFIKNKKKSYPNFPYPFPKPSVAESICLNLFNKNSNRIIFLKDIEEKLRNTLDLYGYSERGYYLIPNGFALVTRLEQINFDGSSKKIPYRWSDIIKNKNISSLKKYMNNLFTNNPTYYRLFVFAVTDQPLAYNDIKYKTDDFISFFNKGLNKLPKDIGNKKYSKDYKCTTLIYIFEKKYIMKKVC